ncbi:GNAT family N-acetyltransferase [Microbacterium sp. A204]|uniref:GNAT family N-acetyltransferase n=1 Tax=Microbacterium sp. A204 TaxID=3457321 RepID=UPI003FD11141
MRSDDDGVWIEHFYLDPAQQGQGTGSWALARILSADTAGQPFRLNVLQGSPARRLYERHGFTLVSQDPIDVYLMKPAPGSKC